MKGYAAKAFAMFALILTLTVGVISYGGYQIIVQSKESTHSNGALLRILLAVSGCTTADTPDVCRQRQIDRSVAEGAARIADVDCRLRVALAGKPPLAPGQTCVPGK